MRSLILVILFCCVLAACVTTRENYVPAGFSSVAEARAYVPEYLYYAKKLTPTEWEEFYRRFPEYWKDIQTAKIFGSTMEFHPWYSAYAFKWNSLRKKQQWDVATVSRLEKGELLAGDDIFKTTYSLGPSVRIIWDNDFEILTYGSGKAIIFENGLLSRLVPCQGCDMRYNHSSREGMQDKDVITTLGLRRPTY